MRTFVLIGLVLTIAGCRSTPSAPGVTLNQQFTLARGDTASIADTDVVVQFLAVTGDSRCPGDATCIQGGDAIVRLRVYDSDETTNYELHTGDSSKATAMHGDLRIALVQLQPYPFSSLPPIQPDDYRATLTVSR